MIETSSLRRHKFYELPHYFIYVVVQRFENFVLTGDHSVLPLAFLVSL